MTIAPTFTQALAWQSTEQLIAEQLSGMESYMAELLTRTTASRRSLWRCIAVDVWRAILNERMGVCKTGVAIQARKMIERTPGHTIESVSLLTSQEMPACGMIGRPADPAAPVVLALAPSDIAPEDWFGLTSRLPAEQQLARRLLEAGCCVVCPCTVAPAPLGQGIAGYPSFGAPPTERDAIWRLATALGLTFMGISIQTAHACLAALEQAVSTYTLLGVGDAGWLSLILAAADVSARHVIVQKAFGHHSDPRAACPWPEIIHGWALCFGDAELAALVTPRPLTLIEESQYLDSDHFRDELAAMELLGAPRPNCVTCNSVVDTADVFLAALDITSDLQPTRVVPGVPDTTHHHAQALQAKLYELLELAPQQRERAAQETLASRRMEWQALVGDYPLPDAPLEPRGRLATPEFQTERVATFEVCVPVYREPEVFVRGLLSVPQVTGAVRPYPAVICSHGWQGTAEMAHQSGIYDAFALRLAKRGYVTWAPQSYFASERTVQVLYRMASLIGKTEFGLMARLHRRGIDYLASLPFVDATRIAFYGLSYGGYSALWLNGLEPRLAAVVCSGHFNDWHAKTVGQNETSYMNTENASMYVSGMLTRFNHGDMAALACPRPILIEAGDKDWVLRREWVEREFARAHAIYALNGAADRIALAWGMGGHQVFGEAGFVFLDKWLK